MAENTLRRRTGWVVTALLLWAGIASAGVEVVYEDGADFGSYRTYAWKEGTLAGNPQVQAWIEAAVDRELQGKGLRKAGPGAADLYVISHATAKIDWSARGRYIYSVTWDVGILKSDVSAATRGTWVVDLVESASDRAVWRGTASKTLAHKTLSQVRKKIDRIARKMFSNYPPGS